VSVQLYNSPTFGTVSRLLTDMAGLECVWVEGVLYVTSPGNAGQLVERLKKERREKKPVQPGGPGFWF
jgi:hypothetical protein